MHPGPVGPIAFFDSGVGGLPYLAAARHVLPGQRFVYLADRTGFPYGVKSRDEVATLAVGAIRSLILKEHPCAVVVACNTATQHAIGDIRAAFPDIPVIGTVPAIKPAASMTRTGCIAVVATPGAAASTYLTGLAARWAPDCRVVRYGDGGLVEFVERQFLTSTPGQRLDAIRPSTEAAMREGADVLVLGCTHFLHVADDFAALAGSAMTITDSRQGVTARLVSIVGRDRQSDCVGCPDVPSGTAVSAGSGTVVRPDAMYLTGTDAFGPIYEAFASKFGLMPAGTLVPVYDGNSP